MDIFLIVLRIFWSNFLVTGLFELLNIFPKKQHFLFYKMTLGGSTGQLETLQQQKNNIFLGDIVTKRWHRYEKTLPEAQRTQSVESITWVNLSTRIVWNWFQWNFLKWLQIWPPDGATCISSKFSHQRGPLALVPSWRSNSSYEVNTLGPLCLWQCF